MSRIEEIQKQIEELEKKTQELQKELEFEKQKTEIEYPFRFKGECWQLRIDGLVKEDWWSSSGYDRNCYQQGNMFTTQQEARRERDKRELLMRFKQFRDKCNGDWKPDFKDKVKAKYFIVFNHESSELLLKWYIDVQPFESFGCFKNREDAIRAIELFGDEIKRLFVEVEK